MGGVSPEEKNNLLIQKENIEIAFNCINLCGRIGCPLFIAMGTVAEYSYCDSRMDFSKLQTPNDIYSATKVAVHHYLNVLSKQLNIGFIWVVLPSTYGERRADNNIITYTIRSLLKEVTPKYGSLNQMWDFLYVEDVVRAILLVSVYGKTGYTYGVGSGNYHKLKEYIERIRDLINPQLALGIGCLPSNQTTVWSACVNSDQLVADTGFSPTISFDEGISRTILWIKETLI